MVSVRSKWDRIYRGWDEGLNEVIAIYPGQVSHISEAKWKQLKSEFPNRDDIFELIQVDFEDKEQPPGFVVREDEMSAGKNTRPVRANVKR